MNHYWIYVFGVVASVSFLYLFLFRKTAKTESNSVHFLATQIKLEFHQPGFMRPLPTTPQQLFADFPYYMEDKGQDALLSIATGRFNEYTVAAFMHHAVRYHGGYEPKTIDNNGFVIQSSAFDFPTVSLRHRFYVDLFKHTGSDLSLYNRDPAISSYREPDFVEIPDYLINGDDADVKHFLTSIDFTQARVLSDSKLMGIDFHDDKILFFTGMEFLSRHDINDMFYKILTVSDALKKTPAGSYTEH